MTMDAEQIVDRRRLRRKLSFWRVIAFVALAAVVVGALVLAAGPETFVRLARPQIARVTISGFITDNREQSELLDKIARADGVKGVIVAIDSDRRRHGRRRSALRGPSQARRQEADRRHHRHRRRLGRLHGGDRAPTTSSPGGARSPARSA